MSGRRAPLDRRFRAGLDAFRGDERGATAIEFGLVSIPFIGLLAMTFNVALAFFVERNLDAAVQNAARQIRTGAAQGAATTTGSAFLNNYVCPKQGSLLANFLDCTKLIIDVRTATAFTGNDMSNGFYKTPTQNTFCLGAQKTVTVVRVAYPMPWYFPVVTAGAMDSFNRQIGLVNDVPNDGGWKLLLTTASAVRTEPYPVASYQAYKNANGC